MRHNKADVRMTTEYAAVQYVDNGPGCLEGYLQYHARSTERSRRVGVGMCEDHRSTPVQVLPERFQALVAEQDAIVVEGDRAPVGVEFPFCALSFGDGSFRIVGRQGGEQA